MLKADYMPFSRRFFVILPLAMILPHAVSAHIETTLPFSLGTRMLCSPGSSAGRPDARSSSFQTAWQYGNSSPFSGLFGSNGNNSTNGNGSQDNGPLFNPPHNTQELNDLNSGSQSPLSSFLSSPGDDSQDGGPLFTPPQNSKEIQQQNSGSFSLPSLLSSMSSSSRPSSASTPPQRENKSSNDNSSRPAPEESVEEVPSMPASSDDGQSTSMLIQPRHQPEE